MDEKKRNIDGNFVAARDTELRINRAMIFFTFLFF